MGLIEYLRNSYYRNFREIDLYEERNRDSRLEQFDAFLYYLSFTDKGSDKVYDFATVVGVTHFIESLPKNTLHVWTTDRNRFEYLEKRVKDCEIKWHLE